MKVKLPPHEKRSADPTEIPFGHIAVWLQLCTGVRRKELSSFRVIKRVPKETPLRNVAETRKCLPLQLPSRRRVRVGRGGNGKIHSV